MTPRTPHFRTAAVTTLAACSAGVLCFAALARWTSLAPTQMGAYVFTAVAVVGLLALAAVLGPTPGRVDALIAEDGQR